VAEWAHSTIGTKRFCHLSGPQVRCERFAVYPGGRLSGWAKRKLVSGVRADLLPAPMVETRRRKLPPRTRADAMRERLPRLPVASAKPCKASGTATPSPVAPSLSAVPQPPPSAPAIPAFRWPEVEHARGALDKLIAES